MADYFRFFNLPVAFSIDESALRRAWLLNSKKYHPDFHTLEDTAKQAEVLELSTLNNEAFKVLSDYDQRMQYILQMKGLLGDEGQQPPIAQDFLMEMMDINEHLMELEFDFDAEKYETVRQQVENIETALNAELAPIVNQWNETTGVNAELERVKDFFLKKRYLLRIKKNLLTFASA